MIYSIEFKSTGTLIDEFLTSRIKIEKMGWSEERAKRRSDLAGAVGKRLSGADDEKYSKVFTLVTKLNDVLKECWEAQDEVMGRDQHDELVGYFAKHAQCLNTLRNGYIRHIDDLLGESEYTQLEKSYGYR